MPSKTRKQKIRADQRRKTQYALATPSVNTSFLLPSQERNLSNLGKLTYQTKSQHTIQSTTLEIDVSTVKRDLLRIAVFTFFAFFLQIVVYWLLQRG